MTINTMKEIIKQGKIRESYTEGDSFFVYTSDRISIRDKVLPFQVKDKGKSLNRVSKHMYDKAKRIMPSWYKAEVNPKLHRGIQCTAFPLEFVVRSHLTGTMYDKYQKGKRSFATNPELKLRKGMQKNEYIGFNYLEIYHKTDRGDILIESDKHKPRMQKVKELCGLTTDGLSQLIITIYKLFECGKKIIRKNCPKLTMLDTKFEFGLNEKTKKVMLIDELFTPDCTRYGYEQKDGTIKETIKETVRQRFEGKKIKSIKAKDNVEYAKALSKEYTKLCDYLCTDKPIVTIDDIRADKQKVNHHFRGKNSSLNLKHNE